MEKADLLMPLTESDQVKVAGNLGEPMIYFAPSIVSTTKRWLRPVRE